MKFAFSNLKIELAVFNGREPVTVSFTVTNTGKQPDLKSRSYMLVSEVQRLIDRLKI